MFAADTDAQCVSDASASASGERGGSVARVLRSTERFISDMEDELRLSDQQFEKLLLDDSVTSHALPRAETSPEIGEAHLLRDRRQLCRNTSECET